MTQLGEAYRKIRNTFRFALSNLHEFEPARDALAASEMWEMDRWMLHRTAELVRQCRGWYESFEFHRVYHALHDFCAVELSAFYFDVLKDRLYTSAPRSVGRSSGMVPVRPVASFSLKSDRPWQPSERQNRITVGWLTSALRAMSAIGSLMMERG